MTNSDRDVARARILLVDDHEDARELAALTLAEHTLICASGFEEGLGMARQQRFDLYILDSWLPSQSGVELCRAIREFDPHTPILFYSAAAYERDIEEAMQSGAQAYVTKPITPDDLRKTAEQLIASTHKA
jgi:two-component system, OmpR family, phosphate regulon response regulator PhoB